MAKNIVVRRGDIDVEFPNELNTHMVELFNSIRFVINHFVKAYEEVKKNTNLDPDQFREMLDIETLKKNHSENIHRLFSGRNDYINSLKLAARRRVERNATDDSNRSAIMGNRAFLYIPKWLELTSTVNHYVELAPQEFVEPVQISYQGKNVWKLRYQVINDRRAASELDPELIDQGMIDRQAIIVAQSQQS